MAKASPIVRSFNGGEVSPHMEGRTDIDRYPSSMRVMLNAIAAPQGPFISRSGTVFKAKARRPNQYSNLIPFVFSEEQALLLEFSDDRIRFITEDGILVYSPVNATVTSASGSTIIFTSTTLNANVGDQVAISGMPDDYNLNSEVADITAKVGTTYTLNIMFPNKPVLPLTVARVYHVPCSYTEQQRKSLRYTQSVDVMYLTTNSKPKKLSRYNTYDWRLEDMDFKDGPYMPVNETGTYLTPSATGNAIPVMTSNTAPSGTCSGSGNRPTVGINDTFLGRSDRGYAMSSSEFYYAFDEDDGTYWAGDVRQEGRIQYTPSSPFICDGYTVYASIDNRDSSYTSKDFAPGTFYFEGYDGSKWIVLDQQNDYVLYDNGKSTFIEINNDVAYSAYRLRIDKLTRNGSIEARIRRLVMRSKTSASFDITASSVVGINKDQGFKATDVGRLIRVKGTDASWRSLKITAYISTVKVTVQLLGEPLLNKEEIRQWRMGYWSDTTGWPRLSDFFEDRLYMARTTEFPDMFAGSVVGGYEDFSQTDSFGVVLDDSAIVARLNARRLSAIQWVSSDERGIVMGTGSAEYALSAPDKAAITARNIKVRPSTRRGSASVQPVRVDNQLLYVQRSGRTVREFAFVFEADGYKSPSMSQLANHLGVVAFDEMTYCAEPHSIVWMRRKDGSLVGLTYNREENVIGWHRHQIAGSIIDGGTAVIESIADLPQKDQSQDALWLCVVRNINGQECRYIEMLKPFWDFDNEIEDAHYVDSGLRYVGAEPIQVVYGLQHLEGEKVYGLADGVPLYDLTVNNGSVTLPFEASNVVLGLGYDSEGETSRLDNGALDGTAMGKVKRINNITVNLWSSSGGEIGVYVDDIKEVVYEKLEYPGDFSVLEENVLFTGEIGPFTPSPGYGKRGTVWLRRAKSSPLPFNVLSIMPQLNTQDR